MNGKGEFILDEEDLERILNLVEKSDFNYLELTANGVKLVVSKTPFQGSSPSSIHSPEKETPPQKSSYDIQSGSREAPEEHQAQAKITVKDVSDEGKVYVRSPLIGTFYRAPSPGAPPFVEIGDMVNEDMTVGIVEVMKVMTSIKARVKGHITEVLVKNGELIEYDQPLFLVEP